MSKGIMALIFAELGILLFSGLLDPNDPAMWLASTAVGYTFLRLGLIAILGLLLVTHPPRNKYLRIFVGATAVLLSVWSLQSMYREDMKLLDGLANLGAAISMGIVALEYQPEEQARAAKATVPRKARGQHTAPA